MFSLTYLRRELTRRLGRTVVTVVGLAVGVSLVVAITAVSAGLDDAQDSVLDPLAGIGTDLVVTRVVDTTAAADPGAAAQGPFGPGGDRAGGVGANALSAEDRTALLEENASVLTDLSTLGDPGDEFVHDFFLPATQLTFPDAEADTVAGLTGVRSVSSGLTLLAQHQEGTVPEIVAEFQTGGETIGIDQQISPPTPEEEAQIRACVEANGATPDAGGTGPQAGGGRRGFGGALAQCLPERLRRFRGSVTTPQRTITQILNPPQTDITTASYTIAGVDLSQPGVGLLSPGQVVDGEYFSAEGDGEAVLSAAYARRNDLSVGSTLDLNGTTLTVVGLADPPLGGSAADVYLSLGTLQDLSSRDGRVNTLFVRAEDATDVGALAKRIEAAIPGATVTSAEELADEVSGSLVDASNLVDRIGGVLAIVVLVGAFCVAALLTLSSVSKRVRELGTLKAIGWSQRRVVRQVMGESVVQGLLGGIVGAAAGIGAAALAARLIPELEATAPTSSQAAGLFGLGQVSQAASRTIPISAPVHLSLLLAALALAVLGGLVAGTAGAMRAARLRPADALRELG